MRVLVVGGGGREHALAWRLAQEPTVTRVLATPGNAGIAEVAECVAIGAEDVGGIVDIVTQRDVDLTVVGPEVPLVIGLADALRAKGHPVFGPSAAAARIEGSKAFAKEIMSRRGVPTARSAVFEDAEKAAAFVDELGGRAVVKADGLAAGKGVTVAEDRQTAVTAIEESLLDGVFGEAGRTVVIEELLRGPEVSVFAVADALGGCELLVVAQDHKRVGDGDRGPNTGGMGAYSPVPSLSDALVDQIMETAIRPVVEELQPYQGVLFAGLMLTEDGPKVLEYNCRFGDPETQALVPLLSGSLAEVLLAAATGDVTEVRPRLAEGSAVTVVLASRGYPGSYPTGVPIEGVADAEALDGVTVFHAGTTRDDNDRLVTAGGRVLAVTGTGATLAHARERAYAGVARIHFDGMHHRTDIAAAAAQEERS